MTKFKFNILFWNRDSGNAITHGTGLDKEHAAQFRALADSIDRGEHPRLILWRNKDKDRATSADFNLKVFVPSPEQDDSF